MKTMQIGGWATNVVDQEEVFPIVAINEASRLLSAWKGVFPREDTWVQRNHEVPSLVVRLDCVIHNGQLSVYEIEERPAGIGVALTINRQFRDLFQGWLKDWSLIKVVVSSRRGKDGDDYLWSEIVSLEQAMEENSLVLVRAEPKEKEFLALAKRSISSIGVKGDKSYGVALGWWEEIDGSSRLPYNDGFVVKPIQGSKARDVEIYPPKHLKKMGGSSTINRIESVIGRKGRMYLQPFILPMVHPLYSGMFMIYRAFFGYRKETGYIPLGGLWNARPNLKIHGASDAVFGPLILDQ